MVDRLGFTDGQVAVPGVRAQDVTSLDIRAEDIGEHSSGNRLWRVIGAPEYVSGTSRIAVSKAVPQRVFNGQTSAYYNA